MGKDIRQTALVGCSYPPDTNCEYRDLIIVWIAICKAFGKSGAWVLGIIFLPFIFLPLLAFGDAKYSKPAGA